MKFKEVLRDALGEYQWKGNFVWIYPAKGSDMYDRFFTGTWPYNRFLYKCLYTDEIVPQQIVQKVDNNRLPQASETKTCQSSVMLKNEVASIASSKKKRPQTVKPIKSKKQEEPDK